MKRLTNAQLQEATALVRISMLETLTEEEISDHAFSDEFEANLMILSRQSKKRRTLQHILRRCVAATLSDLLP